MSREHAIAWYKRIQGGAGINIELEKYRREFRIGAVAEHILDEKRGIDETTFRYGVEYGVLIALAAVFDLKSGEV